LEEKRKEEAASLAIQSLVAVMLTVSAMQKATVADNQTAYTGTSRRSTKCHTLDKGTAPSLENAYTILGFNKSVC
jgi:hypothetical protein